VGERIVAVIRICYQDFSAGSHEVTWLHGRTERGARGVTVYLLPGLTTSQRRAVIRRLRQEASRGFGPPLPLPQLVVALGLDRVRTAVRVAVAMVRLHPAVTLVPSAFVVIAMALFVVASAEGSANMQKMRAGLADNAAARNGKHPETAPGPAPARTTKVMAQHRQVTVPVAGVARSTAWPGCPDKLSDLVPRPRDGQPACHRAGPLTSVAHTDHLAGPSDFAW
jgi:hypothetical protein